MCGSGLTAAPNQLGGDGQSRAAGSIFQVLLLDTQTKRNLSPKPKLFTKLTELVWVMQCSLC